MRSVVWPEVTTASISPLPVDVWGVVPCSGRSSRMGTPKAMLDAGGRTFIERVLEALRGGGCRRILVSLPSDTGPIAAKARGAGNNSAITSLGDTPRAKACPWSR